MPCASTAAAATEVISSDSFMASLVGAQNYCQCEDSDGSSALEATEASRLRGIFYNSSAGSGQRLQGSETLPTDRQQRLNL